MLTFFRKIRKSLLESLPASDGAAKQAGGSARRYFVYAIGEIALVVIGILIALQINNWNEWKKERALENIVLEDIQANILRNLQLITNATETIEEINQSTEILNKVIEEDSPYSDTLNYHINEGTRSGTFLFKLNSDGYASLQSTGFDILQNEELKDAILNLFEVTYGYVLTTLQFANSIYDYHWWKEYFYKTDMENLIPYHPDEIFHDKRFMTEIMDIAFLRNDFKRSLEKSIEPSQRVLQLINDELGGEGR